MENERRINKCECGSTMFYREGNLIICAKIECDRKWPMKREKDKDIPTFKELREPFI